MIYCEEIENPLRQTAEVPIHNIKHVPVYVFAGSNDAMCPLEQAEWVASQIG